jgi:phosphoribosylglycinamide formyltransferase 1
MVDRIRVAVLISGSGSNLQSLISASNGVDYPAIIALVISNIPTAYGLEIAKNARIPTQTVHHKDYESRNAFEAVIQEHLRAHKIEIICLAGFMRILSADFVNQWPGRILNIHPSLLPKYKGLDTHARVLAAGDAEHGCTVHHVVADLDAGPTILQAKVPVLPGDCVDKLAARVLTQEHRIFPEALAIICRRLQASAVCT